MLGVFEGGDPGRSLEADEPLDIKFQRVGTVTRLGQAGKNRETRAHAQHPLAQIKHSHFQERMIS